MLDKARNILKEIESLEKNRDEEVQKLRNTRHVEFGRKRIVIPESEKEDAIKELKTSYTSKISAKCMELENALEESEKRAIQEYYAAIPRLTAEQRIETESIVSYYDRKYGKEGTNDKRWSLEEKLKFHVDNQTVEALPHIYAHKEMFPDWEIPIEWYSSMSPELVNIKAELDEIKIIRDEISSRRALEFAISLAKQSKNKVSDSPYFRSDEDEE